MSFFVSLYNSLYNFKWLASQKSNTGSAWSYFFLLIILVAGLSTISLGFKFAQTAPKIKEAIHSELPEFQAEVKNGELQVVSLVQPYIKSYENFTIAVDTVATSTLDIMNFVKQDDQSVLLVTKNNISVYDAQSKTTKSQPIKDYGDFKTDRAGVLQKVDSIFVLKMVWIVTLVTFGLLILFLSVSYLLNILVVSFLFYTIAKQQKLVWSFKEVFTVGLFTTTLPLILAQSVSNPFFNWFFMLMFAGWMYMVILKKDKIEQV